MAVASTGRSRGRQGLIVNEKFFALPEEKRNAIINAGFSVFSRHEYRKASTDDVAKEAGISKALLFHYFGSKKGFYVYLYDYAIAFLVDGLSALHDYEETDFFEILKNAQECKLRLLVEHPDVMQFIVRGYLADDGEVSPELDKSFQAVLAKSVESFLKRADASKFKDSITVKQALEIALWMSDGFMRAQTPEALSDLRAVNDEFLRYLDILKAHFYREECL